MADITGEEGQTLEVSYQIDNTGSSSDTQDINLLVDGTQEDSDTGVTVAAGGSQTGTLSWVTQSGDAGTYTVSVESADSSASFSAEVINTGPATIDSFEDQDFAEYTDYGSGGLTTGTTFVTDGTYGMEISRDAALSSILSLSGLNYYPKPGDTWRFDIRFSSTSTNIYHPFLLQNNNGATSGQQGFRANIEAANQRLKLEKDGNTMTLATQSVTINADTDYTAEISINESTGEITFRLLDSTGTELASVSATDADASSGGAYDSTYGIGFAQNDTSNSGSTTYIDYVRKVAQ